MEINGLAPLQGTSSNTTSANTGGMSSPNRRGGFRPAWSKDGGTFGTPKAADAGTSSTNDFAQLSLSGPGGPPLGNHNIPPSSSSTTSNSKLDSFSSWGTSNLGGDNFDRPRTKKAVIRLNRDEILALRKPSSKVIAEVVEKLPPEVLSIPPLEPECSKPLDERAIHRIWHDQPRNKSGSAPRQPGQGRGRGGSPNTGPVNTRWSPQSGPASSSLNSVPSIGGGGMNTMAMGGWKRGQTLSNPGAPGSTMGNVLGSNSGTWGKKPVKPTDPGSFFLGAGGMSESTDAGGGSWTRGLKLSDQGLDDKLEQDDAADFYDDDDDDNLDLAGLSSTALQFELEKQKMQGMYQETPNQGGVNATFASLFNSAGTTTESSDTSVRVDSMLAVSTIETTQKPPSPPAPSPPAPSTTDSNSWFYLDPNGLVQGPFKGEQMKLWHKLRYFEPTPNLPVRNGPVGEFTPLSELPNAFEEYGGGGDNQSSQEAANKKAEEERQQQEHRERERQIQEARAREEEEEKQRREQALFKQQQAEQAERARKEEQDRREAAEAQAIQLQRWEMERDAKHAAEEERRRLQKAALDALMEKQAADERAEQLQRQQMQNRKNNEIASSSQVEVERSRSEAEIAADQKKAWGNGVSSPSSTSAGNLAEIQQAEESARSESEQLKLMLGMGGGGGQHGGKVWGATNTAPKSAPVADKGNVKSLLDIQAEEQRAAAMRKKSEPARAGGHWAALASNAPAPAAKGVWGPGRSPPVTTQQAPRPPVQAYVAAPTPMPPTAPNKVGGDGWEEAGGKKRGTNPQSNGMQSLGSTSNPPKSKDSKAFGGPSLDQGLNAWCEDQLRRLTGNDDMTLILFCMSLDDPAEIRSYLGAYLGAKPEVSHFATEFIRRKQEAKRGHHHTAASVVAGSSSSSSNKKDDEKKKKGNKGKKGKKVDPSLLGYNVQSNRIMQGEIDHGD
jgi:hypothetical protein